MKNLNCLRLNNIHLESGKIIRKRFEKLKNNKNNLIKYHYLLKNAFNPNFQGKKQLHRNFSNDDDMNFILRENRKNPSRFNINNYKNLLDPIKNNLKLNSKDDKLMNKILFLFDRKNDVKYYNIHNKLNNIKKNKLEIKIPIIPTRKIKIIPQNNSSTSCSNNVSKFISSSNRNEKNFLNNDENIDFKTYFYPPLLDRNFFKIYQNLTKNEKNLYQESIKLNKEIKKIKSSNEFLKIDDSNIKNRVIKRFKSSGNLIENPEKIKNMENIEKILFSENKKILEQAKNKLYYFYKNKLKLPSFDDD